MTPRISIRRRPRPAPPALTAAAQPVRDPAKAFKSKGLAGRTESWQDEAWTYLDKVGELRFYSSWLSSSVSRVRLVASEVNDETGVPSGFTENANVRKVVHDIADGLTGQAQMLKRLAVFLLVPGEGYLAMLNRTTASIVDATGKHDPVAAAMFGDDRIEWVTVSRDEVTTTNGGVVLIAMPDGTRHTYDKDADLLVRVWNQHPRRASEADSPVRAARQSLAEIVRTSGTIDNAARSRTVGNGIVFLPQEMSLPKPAADPGDERMVGANAADLQDMIFEVATTATEDPDSMAAFLPIMASVPGEYTDKVKHVKFDSDVSSTALVTRDSAIRRLAMSLDIAPERLLGMGANSNHWSAWAIGEDDIKVHIAPVVETICDALTEYVLRPTLEAAGLDPARFVVWYDATPLTQDPDRKTEAKDLFDRGAITASKYRAILGFDDEDGYDLDTAAGWAALAQDKAAADISTLPMLVPLLGADVQDVKPVAIEQRRAAEPVQDAEVVEDTRDQPDDVAASDVQAAAVHMLVDRALELANKRRRSRSNHALYDGLPIHAAHTRLGPVPRADAPALIDGWDAILDANAAARLGLDHGALRGYVAEVAVFALVTGTAPVITRDDLGRIAHVPA